jgi:hypothetical protein
MSNFCMSTTSEPHLETITHERGNTATRLIILQPSSDRFLSHRGEHT